MGIYQAVCAVLFNLSPSSSLGFFSCFILKVKSTNGPSPCFCLPWGLYKLHFLIFFIYLLKEKSKEILAEIQFEGVA